MMRTGLQIMQENLISPVLPLADSQFSQIRTFANLRVQPSVHLDLYEDRLNIDRLRSRGRKGNVLVTFF